MRLVADENVPRPVIERLRADGLAVHSIAEVNAGVPDRAVMQASRERAIILITYDRDFGELAIRDGLPVTGVILLELERLSLDGQVERVSKCLAAGAAEWIGHFSVVESARVRRRPLPESPAA